MQIIKTQKKKLTQTGKKRGKQKRNYSPIGLHKLDANHLDTILANHILQYIKKDNNCMSN